MNNYQLDHAKKFMDIERIFSVHQITEKDEKLKYIQICDSAYTFSVVQKMCIRDSTCIVHGKTDLPR